MKKTVKILFMMIAIITLAVVMTACIKFVDHSNTVATTTTTPDPETCVHLYWGFSSSCSVDCDQDGYIEMICEICDYKMRVVIPAQHRDVQYIEAVPATCMPGRNAGEYCYSCQSWISGGEEIESAYEHEWDIGYFSSKKATCTQNGYNKNTLCHNCGTWKVETTNPATGHCFVDGICINEMYKTSSDGFPYLTQCGEIESPTIECEHKNTELLAAVEPTCAKTGHAEFVICLDCGVAIEGDNADIPATGEHVYENNVCISCNKSISCKHETVIVNPEDHYWNPMTGWKEHSFCLDCGFFVHIDHIDKDKWPGYCDVCGLEIKSTD